MLKKFSEELYLECMEELRSVYLAEADGMKRLMGCLTVIRRSLKSLKAYLDDHPFGSPQEEIEFFKYIKPKFYQWLIYYQEKHTLDSRKPAENGKAAQRYYAEQLKFYDRFFRQNEFHFQYYKLNAAELDNLYFIRGAEMQQILIPEVPDIDPAFGTSMDYLFAKFMAYEQLQQDLVKGTSRRKQSNGLSGTTVDAHGRLHRRFQWTGETVNLIEIAHGIYLNGQVNEGDIGINEFFEGLGEFFGVNLGVPKRGFEDLKARKRLSKTHFTDRVKDALLKKMEEEDAYNPHKGLMRK